MAAPTNLCIVKINLANLEPSTHGTKRTYCVAAAMSAFGCKADMAANCLRLIGSMELGEGALIRCVGALPRDGQHES